MHSSITASDYNVIPPDQMGQQTFRLTKKALTHALRQGFYLLIHVHVLFAFPRVHSCAEHIPFNFFCFDEMFKNVFAKASN